MHAVEVTGLSFAYAGGPPVLRDLSLTLEPGWRCLLLGANGPAQLAEFVDRELGPVSAYDLQRGTSLVATLDAWFASGGSLKDTAAALHVHPNTVTQRLDRVTGLLGESWRAPERALDLQLALRVARLQA